VFLFFPFRKAKLSGKEVIKLWLIIQEESRSSSDIGCPTCSKKTTIPNDQQAKDFLKPNFNLRDLVEKMKKTGRTFSLIR
jgi:hypothetical protein